MNLKLEFYDCLCETSSFKINDIMVFKDKKTAEKYLSIKPFPYNMDIKELTLYEVD